MPSNHRAYVRWLSGLPLAVLTLLAWGCSGDSSTGGSVPMTGPSPEALVARATVDFGSSSNCLDREPVLFYEVSGATFAGPYHRRLALYCDGTASVSEVITSTSRAAFNQVDAVTVREFRTQLLNGGANVLQDDCHPCADLPMTTVTFFTRPGPHTTGHTYSYYLPEGDCELVDELINAFIEREFPEF